jgi:signal transduction histidine kinase
MSGLATMHDEISHRMTPRAHKFAVCGAFAVLAAFALGPPASARNAQDAQSLAERAVRHIADVGRDQAFADFSRPDGGYVDGELYIFCQDASGVVVAHGGNPRLVGQNLADVRGPDGRFPNIEINQLGLTQGSGWLEFRWPNPATHRVALKSAYVLKVDDHTVCGSGYYQDAPP